MIDIDRFEEFSRTLMAINREITRIKSKHMSKFGLGSTHTMCIVALSTKGPLTAGELASSEDVDKAQMSRVLSDLIKKEYVSIIEDESKKYKRKYTLTEHGKEMAAEIRSIVQEILSFVDRGLDEDDVNVMHRTLLRINRNIAKVSKEF